MRLVRIVTFGAIVTHMLVHRPSTIGSRYAKILDSSTLALNSTHTISYTHRRDMIWTMEPLPTHPNGMKFSVFDKEGDMLATNTYFSVGGGFVVNERTQGEFSCSLQFSISF